MWTYVVGRERGSHGIPFRLRAALHSHDTGTATCESELWRMQAVIDRIDTKIAELQATRREVSDTMNACQQGHCRFSSLAQHTPTAQRY
jgi:hypothetical protein